MQNTTQKIKDGATRTSQKPARYLARYCSSYNTPTLFFEIYILPTIDTGEALRIVPRWPLVKKAVHRLCTLECHPNMLLQDAVDQTANQPISAIFQLYHMTTRFSCGRNRSTQREPQTMGKQLINFITCGCESSAPSFVIYKAGREPTLYCW
jgi:hypothetical protein